MKIPSDPAFTTQLSPDRPLTGGPILDEATPVDMLDNSGKVISYPEYLGVESFVMHDTGSAY